MLIILAVHANPTCFSPYLSLFYTFKNLPRCLLNVVPAPAFTTSSGSSFQKTSLPFTPSSLSHSLHGKLIQAPYPICHHITASFTPGETGPAYHSSIRYEGRSFCCLPSFISGFLQYGTETFTRLTTGMKRLMCEKSLNLYSLEHRRSRGCLIEIIWHRMTG